MTATTADLNYSYYGLPLTPAIAQELISELFAGRTAKRQEIVDAVVDAHRVRGGTQATAVNVSHTIKKSLQELKRKKLASNPSSGYWRIKGITAPPAIQPALISAEVRFRPTKSSARVAAASTCIFFQSTKRRQYRSAKTVGSVR